MGLGRDLSDEGLWVVVVLEGDSESLELESLESAPKSLSSSEASIVRGNN